MVGPITVLANHVLLPIEISVDAYLEKMLDHIQNSNETLSYFLVEHGISPITFEIKSFQTRRAYQSSSYGRLEKCQFL